jgi:hypothetical protein
MAVKWLGDDRAFTLPEDRSTMSDEVTPIKERGVNRKSLSSRCGGIDQRDELGMAWSGAEPGLFLARRAPCSAMNSRSPRMTLLMIASAGCAMVFRKRLRMSLAPGQRSSRGQTAIQPSSKKWSKKRSMIFCRSNDLMIMASSLWCVVSRPSHPISALLPDGDKPISLTVKRCLSALFEHDFLFFLMPPCDLSRTA